MYYLRRRSTRNIAASTVAAPIAPSSTTTRAMKNLSSAANIATPAPSNKLKTTSSLADSQYRPNCTSKNNRRQQQILRPSQPNGRTSATARNANPEQHQQHGRSSPAAEPTRARADGHDRKYLSQQPSQCRRGLVVGRGGRRNVQRQSRRPSPQGKSDPNSVPASSINPEILASNALKFHAMLSANTADKKFQSFVNDDGASMVNSIGNSICGRVSNFTYIVARHTPRRTGREYGAGDNRSSQSERSSRANDQSHARNGSGTRKALPNITESKDPSSKSSQSIASFHQSDTTAMNYSTHRSRGSLLLKNKNDRFNQSDSALYGSSESKDQNNTTSAASFHQSNDFLNHVCQPCVFVQQQQDEPQASSSISPRQRLQLGIPPRGIMPTSSILPPKNMESPPSSKRIHQVESPRQLRSILKIDSRPDPPQRTVQEQGAVSKETRRGISSPAKGYATQAKLSNLPWAQNNGSASSNGYSSPVQYKHLQTSTSGQVTTLSAEASPGSQSVQHYQIGQTLASQDHSLPFTAVSQASIIISKLPINSPLFVKRTNRQWTYALLVGHTSTTDADKGGEKSASVIVALDSKSSIMKVLAESKWGHCLRMVNDKTIIASSGTLSSSSSVVAGNAAMSVPGGSSVTTETTSTMSYYRKSSAPELRSGITVVQQASSPRRRHSSVSPGAYKQRTNSVNAGADEATEDDSVITGTTSIMPYHSKCSGPDARSSNNAVQASLPCSRRSRSLNSVQPEADRQETNNATAIAAINFRWTAKETDFKPDTPVAVDTMSESDASALMAVQRAHNHSCAQVIARKGADSDDSGHITRGAAIIDSKKATFHLIKDKSNTIPDAIKPFETSSTASIASGSKTSSNSSLKPQTLFSHGNIISNNPQRSQIKKAPSTQPESPTTVMVNLNAKTFSGSRRDRMRPSRRRCSATSLDNLGSLGNLALSSAGESIQTGLLWNPPISTLDLKEHTSKSINTSTGGATVATRRVVSLGGGMTMRLRGVDP